MQIPDQLNDVLREILGMVPWSSGPIAHVMRADGADIARKMEAEQAAVLHWLLSVYAEHGEAWRPAAGELIVAMRSRVRAAQPAPAADPA